MICLSVINFKRTIIQRYRIQDLRENAEECEKNVDRLRSILKQQEACYYSLVEEKENLIAQTVVRIPSSISLPSALVTKIRGLFWYFYTGSNKVKEEEAIRREAEAAALAMQRQIDTLHQGLEVLVVILPAPYLQISINVLKDYRMQANDLESQLKQLRLEIRLIEIMNSEEKDGVPSSLP